MITYIVMAQTFSRPIRRLLVAQGMVGLGGGIFSVLLNLYLKSLGYDEEIIGRLLALQSATAAFASIPLGTLADRTSRRTAYLAGLAFLVVGSVICAQSEQLWILVIASAISGVGNGGMMVSVQPFLQENSRRRQRPYLFSVNFTIMLLMSIAAGVIAGWLPAWLNSLGIGLHPESVPTLRTVLLLGVGCMLLAFAPALRLPHAQPGTGTSNTLSAPRSTPLEAAPAPTPPTTAAWTDEDRRAMALITRFAIADILIGAGAGLIVPYFNLYFRDWVNASVAQIGTVFAVGQLGTALGGIASPWISRRFGLVGGVVWTQVLSLPFMLIMAWRHEYFICAVCYFFRGAFMNMNTPIRQGTLMELMPAPWRARAAAAESIAWNLAWSVSMLFSGGLIRTHGYDFCLHITFVCYLVSALLYYRFFAPLLSNPDARPRV